ncbi:MAG: hypothetical protein MI757_02495 [Pirellulales bacterium]|nr:hypothetical protein [Pirellulales bacterium]
MDARRTFPTGDRRTLRGFDFTAHVRRLALDMVTRTPDLAHIDLSRVAFSFAQARKRVSHGIQASLTPMRFESGSLTGWRRGRQWTVQRLIAADGTEMLYILTLYLPRFMDQPFEEKLATLVHELWHISPAFDGDLRRHAGRCYAHTSSQAAYDAEVDRVVERWLSLDPPQELYRFLRLNFDELERRHGGVYGQRIAIPKLIPVEC